MAPKALAPPMTEAEKAELSRLLEKAKLNEDAERTQADRDVGYAKMAQDWATWKLDSADGAGSTTVVKVDGNPWHRNLKSMAHGSDGMPMATAGQTYAGSMTDASKRLHAAVDMSPPSDGFEVIDPEALLEEKIMLEEIAARSSGMIPPLPVGHHGNPTQYPLGKRAGLNNAVPLPTGTTDEEWYDTLCELPSVKDRFLSYAELRDCARNGDTTVRGLLNFCSTKFGDQAIEQLRSTGSCKKDGYDIAAWLRRNCWDVCETNSGSTFKRTSKASVVRAKGGGKGQ